MMSGINLHTDETRETSVTSVFNLQGLQLLGAIPNRLLLLAYGIE